MKVVLPDLGWGIFSRLLIMCLCLYPLQGYAQRPTPIAPPAVYPADTWQGKDVAVVHVLDRIRSQVQTILLPKNQTRQIGTLDITMRRCLRRAPTLSKDDAVWLEVRDNKIKTSSFDGWMIRSMPQIGIFENPVYDVRLVQCVGNDTDPLLPKLIPERAPDPIPTAATRNSGGLDNLRIQPENHKATIVQQPLSAMDVPPSDESDDGGKNPHPSPASH